MLKNVTFIHLETKMIWFQTRLILLEQREIKMIWYYLESTDLECSKTRPVTIECLDR